jgi:hypothetical protein
MVTMMMPLPTRRNRVLRPERAIQEMPAGQRRTRHSRNRRDARAKWRRIRATSTHAKREHTIEHCFHPSNPINKKKMNEFCWEVRTGSDERFGGRLAYEVREREWGTDAFERAEVPEYHRGLARSEAEDGLVSLPPLFVEKPRASLRIWAGRTLQQYSG